MSKYQIVIGLEIHIQGKTNSKMFCSCDAKYFGDLPNTHVCPVCLGLPGALPVPNKAGIDQAIKLALALNCQISEETKFDRKNYFYPDLPKAYQISQYDQPIGYEGYLEIDIEGDSRRIRITRTHLEEDTGKSIHQGDATYLDFNKSGVPLIEVVTEPDFQDVAEVLAFSRLLKQTVVYLGVSDAEMQKGQMRFELNISLKKEGETELPDYRVEVKNIGSISVLEKVIEFEFIRQSALLDAGEKIHNETRGLLNMTGETVSQRVKESENDYRYFPEPDIPPIQISGDWIETIQKEIPELPAARRDRYVKDFGFESQQADILVEQREKGDWIDDFAELVEQKENKSDLVKEATKWLTGEISGILEKDSNMNFEDLPVSHADMLYLVESMLAGKTSGSIVKKVIAKQMAGEGSAEEIVKKEGLEQVSDEGQIKEWAEKAIQDNPKAVESLEKNPNAIKSLVGKVMGMSRGMANPQVVEKVLKDLLSI